MNRVIRVLVVDDSAYIRKMMRQMLTCNPSIEVVGTARNGIEALELVEQLQPDVVTLDLIMPEMDGVAFLREQMKRRPLPVVVVSIASESGDLALQALDAGAVDFIQKPTALATERVLEISQELIEKVQAAAGVSVTRLPQAALPAVAIPQPLPLAAVPRKGLVDVVVIGISTGGPQALKQLIPQLPGDFPVPVGIVLHMPVGYTEMYAARLNAMAPLTVVEAHEGEEVVPGKVLLAPAGHHMLFIRAGDGSVRVHLDLRPLDTAHRPSVDVLFRSAAEVYRERTLGVVMTGMGNDGLQGAAWIKSQGGLVYTEAEETCVVYGMPRSIVEAGLSDRSVPLDAMARAILEVV